MPRPGPHGPLDSLILITISILIISHQDFQLKIQCRRKSLQLVFPSIMNTDQQATAAEEVNKARKELDKVREELNNFKAIQQVPSYFEDSTTEYFLFLTQQVKDRAAELKDREAALIALAQLEFQKAESSKPPSNKRARSGSSQSTQLTQTSFRQRIVARDGVCLITGKEQESCQAAHIIAKCNFNIYDIQANKLWDERFPNCCDNPEHRVMDTRNGLLLWNPIHTAFDNFELTIRKEENIFKVETQDFIGSQLIHSFNGRTIQFNSERRHEWPREEFLKFHNECFDARSVALKAAAEESSDDEQYQETLAESVKKSKVWLEQTV
jgi:HNH endonuclease